MSRWSRVEGLAFPLGQSWVHELQSFNFALYSKNAAEVWLVLFDAADFLNPVAEFQLDYLAHKSGRIWHTRIVKSDANGAKYYAYRMDGPPSNGGFDRHHFDPAKLVVDPYTRCIFFPPDFSRAAARGSGSNIGKAPLGLLLEEPPAAHSNIPTPRHEADLIVYEMHVRGFTRHASSSVAPQRRGTFAGVVDKIPYLVDLGVTAVELMPVFEIDPQQGNYWGYDPLFFFVPQARYASTSDLAAVRGEFRAMVDALHTAGIEVLLDVVYNHTGEADSGGPAYSFKLIDNSTYYMVDPNSGAYRNYAGTGNSLHVANRAVRRLIVDSMRYWVREMGVDGFRFDLASVFSRNTDGSVNLNDPPIFAEIAADPSLAGVRLIAEPWDAESAYQLGRSFPGVDWRQWNGRYRDAIQRFNKSDSGMIGEMMSRVYGSADLFPDDLMGAYRPYQSVNFFRSHDGFTLYDLVTYQRKHNEANGHNNTDGTNDLSWNSGWEGDVGVPADVKQLRMRRMKNFFALLLVSNGTPMFTMGDEFGHTQGGNNNPYNQDNETSWLNWNRLNDNQELWRFTREMIAFRKRHPSLSRSQFWRGEVRWYGVGPNVDFSDGSRCLAFHVQGASQGDVDIYVMANSFWEDLEFGVQAPGPWKVAVDTGQASPNDISPPGAEHVLSSARYRLRARSIVVLVHT